MYPASTGLARNSAMKPRRASPASASSPPVISASSAVRFRNRSALPAAIGATVAAERIATPELGPTFSCRLVPSSA